VVNGALASPVIVESGGTLGGSGIVGGITARSGSTVAPGSAIGTLNVNGNVSSRRARPTRSRSILTGPIAFLPTARQR
jgi:uncharacterized protein with beta-barrel porin domain